MHCLDTTFCIDLANGAPAAVKKAHDLDERRERLTLPAPVLTEFLTGAHARGGRQLAQALELVAQVEVLPVDEAVALAAAELGGECLRRGTPVGTLDLLIAAVAKTHRGVLLTRDRDFSRIPGLLTESY